MNAWIVAAAAVAGVLIGCNGPPGDGHGAIVVGVAAALVAVVVTKRPIRVAAVAVCIAVTGIALAQRASNGLTHTDFPTFGAVTVRGALVGDADAIRFGAVALLRVDHLDGEPVADRIVLLRASGDAGQRLALLEAGDVIEVRGGIEPLGSFDERRIWEHVVATVRVSLLQRMEPAPQWYWAVANAGRAVILRGAAALPTTERALMLGFLLGDTRALPQSVVDNFRAAGMSHLLAVSGANLTFLFAGLAPLLTRLGRRSRAVSMLAVVAVFGAMTRWEPSVIRAAAMVGVAVLAQHVGRPQAASRVLALAITVLVLLDPFLVMRVGFQLSVAACVGLVFVTPRIAERLRLPAVVTEGVSTTGGAIVGTAPVQLAVFGTVPLVAIPANLAAGASAAVLTVWGFGATAAAGLLPGLAPVVHVPSVLLLRSQLAIAAIASRHPLAVDRRAVAALVVAAALAALAWKVHAARRPAHMRAR
ncbi:MAG: ComEC/Rec2 family competence protein [Acidimicrobiia bacterium]